jgi:hypothetical protein
LLWAFFENVNFPESCWKAQFLFVLRSLKAASAVSKEFPKLLLPMLMGFQKFTANVVDNFFLIFFSKLPGNRLVEYYRLSETFVSLQ